MRFVKENTGAGIAVPAAVLRLSGMGEEPRLELHVLDKAVLLLEERMTAMELVTAIHSLYRQTLELLAHLAEVCGSWEWMAVTSSMAEIGRASCRERV